METKHAGWLTIGGGAALIVGSFMPWVMVTAPFIGTISFSGIDTDDHRGWLSVVLGGIAVWLGSRLVGGKDLPTRRGLWISGLLAGVFTVAQLVIIKDVFEEAESQPGGDMILPTIGLGLWLMLVGAVATLVVAWAWSPDKAASAAPAPTAAWPASVTG